VFRAGIDSKGPRCRRSGRCRAATRIACEPHREIGQDQSACPQIDANCGGEMLGARAAGGEDHGRVVRVLRPSGAALLRHRHSSYH
jgi:hypothetical protein